MRVIKFRAWSSATEKISDWDFIHSVGNLHKLITLKHIEVMQFTGLTDKNGKEIYEGDIISTPKGICQVTFELGCFYAITVSRYRLGGWVADCIEVIGNIHEHPELIAGRHEA